MNKNFTFLFLIFIITACNSQQENVDRDLSIYNPPQTSEIRKDSNDIESRILALKKYSHLILGINEDDSLIGNGTGFFIRDHNTLFFITCKHVAFHKGVVKLEILLNDMFLDVYMKDFPKDSFNVKTMFDSDVAVLPLNDASDYSGEVSEMLDPNYFDKPPIEYVFFGYRWNPQSHSYKDEYIPQLFRSPHIDQDSFYTTTFNKTVQETKQFFKDVHFLVPVSINKGVSGSPVFGIYNVKGLKEIKFLGLMPNGFNEYKDLGIATNAKTILNIIHKQYR